MPTIGGPDGTVDGRTDEPGGSTCKLCRDPIEPGDWAYRETHGKVATVEEHGLTFGFDGGVGVHHYCHDCYVEHRKREKVTHYPVPDADTLWEILEGANGTLVADAKPMTVGGRGWFRVVGGELEARHSVRRTVETDSGFEVRVTTEPSTDFDVNDFGDFFGDEPDETGRRIVYLRPVGESPFADGGDLDGDGDG